MAGRVFIAEKPSVARAIAQVLPGRGISRDGYIEVGDDIVTWCFGHLMCLAEAVEYDEKYRFWRHEHLPIVPDEFMVLPNTSDKGYLKQIKVIDKLVRGCQQVVHAGDADREGHLLVQWVLNHIGCRKPIQRLWLSANDPISVKRALSAMKPNQTYQGLFESGECRAFADWLVGINLSRAYTLVFKSSGADQMVSVGRVQSPTLAMIVERDLAIEAFRSVDYFVPWILLEARGKRFKARWVRKDHPDLKDGLLVSKATADNIISHCQDARVISVTVDRKDEGQPALYRLTTLQSACSGRFGMTGDETLATAQALYEKHALISYPRTDSSFLPVSQHAEAPEMLKAIAFRYTDMKPFVAEADLTIMSAAFNDKKVTAHHAIVPTRGDKSTYGDLTDREAQVYDLIVRAYLAQFFPPHVYDETKIELEAGGEPFRATGRVSVSAGWRCITTAEQDEDEQGDEEDANAALPRVNQNDVLPIVDKQVDTKSTTPPKPYTDGSLLRDMENIHRLVQRKARLEGPEAIERTAKIVERLKAVAGIGTEATRSNMIKLLVKRGYVVRKARALKSTALGRDIVAALPSRITSPEMTALFEQALDDIKTGEMARDQFMDVQRRWLQEVCLAARDQKVKLSPALQTKKPRASKVAVSSVSQPAQQKSAAVVNIRPKPVAQHQAAPGHPHAGMACPACGTGRMLLRGTKDKPFLGCSRFPDCKKGILLNRTG